LVQEGKIKPSENPWLALGAQEASGVIEGQKARVEFQALYDKQALENPNFFKDRNAFDALASSFMTNKETLFKDSMYLRRAFHESFDPVIPQMGLAHEKEVTERRIGLVVGGVDSKVLELVQNLEQLPSDSDVSLDSWWDTPEYIRKPVPQMIQDHRENLEARKQAIIGDFKEWINQSPEAAIGRGILNSAIVNRIIDIRKQGEYSKEAKYLMETLNLGSGLLFETQEARGAVAAAWADIKAGDEIYTKAKQQAFEKELVRWQREVLDSKNAGSTLADAKDTLYFFIDSLPINQQTMNVLRNSVDSALANVGKQKQQMLVQQITDQVSDQMTRDIINTPRTQDERDNTKVQYTMGLFDTLSMVLGAHGLNPSGGEELWKFQEQVKTRLEMAFTNAVNRGYIERATNAFTSLGGFEILGILNNPLDPSWGTIGRVKVDTQDLQHLSDVITTAANRSSPGNQQEEPQARENLWSPITTVVKDRLGELRRMIEDKGSGLSQENWGVASMLAEQLYSVLVQSALNTSNGTQFANMVDEVKTYARNYDPDKGPPNPMLSAAVRVLSQLSYDDIEKTKASNQSHDHTLTVVGGIRKASANKWTEKDIIMELQGRLSREGPNFFSSNNRFSVPNRNEFYSTMYQSFKDAGINLSQIRNLEGLFTYHASEPNIADVYSTDIKTWVANTMKKWKEKYYKINGGYVDKQELIQAFTVVDPQTNKYVPTNEEEAASYINLVFKYHPAFAKYSGLSLQIEHYPKHDYPDTFKYQVVTPSGNYVLDKPLTLEEFQGK